MTGKPHPYIPLIAEKHWSEHTAETWKPFVESLFIAPPPPPPPKSPWTITVTKKGVVTLRMNRKPAYLTREESETCFTEYAAAVQGVGKPAVRHDQFFVLLGKRDIPIREHAENTIIVKAQEEIPW